MAVSECVKCGSLLKGVTVDFDYCVLYFLFCDNCGHLNGVDFSRSKLRSKLAFRFGWLDGDLDRWMFTLNLVPFSSRKLRVLDVGAAPGCLTRMVRELFGYEVCSLDSSRVISDKGYDFQKYVNGMKQSGIVVEDCDLDRDPFPFTDKTFDVVLFTEVIEHLHKPLLALGEIYRVLRANGRLVLSTPNFTRVTNRIRAMLGKPKTSHGVKEYTPKELKKLLEDRNFVVNEVIFSDWSERKYLKKLQTKSPKPPIFYIVWTLAKYCIVRIMPSLSSYVFIAATKQKPGT